MKWLPLLLASALPALAQLPPVPPGAPGYIAPIHSPKHLELLSSLGTSMAKAVTLAASAPIQSFTLIWDWTNTYATQPGYPTNYATNIVFEVYFTQAMAAGPPLTRYDATPSNFYILGTTPWPNTRFNFLTNLPFEGFIVRAKDTLTNKYSYWNQK